MPTYDYRCKQCGHSLELFQAMSEAPKKKCPACGKPSLERLIGAGAGILFKGKGFYQTDYRSKSYKDSAQKEKGTSEGSASAGEKQESPSAPKPEKGPKPGKDASKKKD